MKTLAAALCAAFLLSSCAGVAEFRLPREFKGKKQVEDPPLSYCPAPEARPCA